MQVIDLKPKRSKPRDAVRDVPLEQLSDAGRYLERMCHDIELDLGGRRELTRIEIELIRAFAGSATVLKYLNVQVTLGETGELDLTGYSTTASTMLRIGSKLGLQRRKAKTNKQSFGDYADYERLEQPPAVRGAGADAGDADVDADDTDGAA